MQRPRYALVIQHRAHLSHDLSRARFRFIPSRAVRQNWQSTAQPTWLETQIVARSHARPAFASRFTSVASLTSISLRHPHCLDALAVRKRHQISDRPVSGYEFLLLSGKADGNSLLQQDPKLLGSVGNLFEGFNSLT